MIVDKEVDTQYLSPASKWGAAQHKIAFVGLVVNFPRFFVETFKLIPKKAPGQNSRELAYHCKL